MPKLRELGMFGEPSSCESSLDVAGYSENALETFQEHGFCIVLDALKPLEVKEVLATCQEVERRIVHSDPEGLGTRGFGRYSFGASAVSGHMLHHPAWRHLLNSEAVLNALRAIYPKGFHVYGGGGDFVRPGTEAYQPLHSDLAPSRLPEALRSLRPPMVSVNFTVQHITAQNGPLRLVPGQRALQPGDVAPGLEEELEDWRRSKVCPLPPGAAIIRDLRLYHGGTPNLSGATRFLPSIELVSTEYWAHLTAFHSLRSSYCPVCRWRECSLTPRYPCITEKVFQQLRPEVKSLCAPLVGAVPLGLRHSKRQAWPAWPLSFAKLARVALAWLVISKSLWLLNRLLRRLTAPLGAFQRLQRLCERL